MHWVIIHAATVCGCGKQLTLEITNVLADDKNCAESYIKFILQQLLAIRDDKAG